jgi:hypothetical protein
MTLEESLNILNNAIATSVMDATDYTLCTKSTDIIKDIGLDSLDWSIVLIYIEDEVLLSEEVITELGKIINDGGTIQDMLEFFNSHGL